MLGAAGWCALVLWVPGLDAQVCCMRSNRIVLHRIACCWAKPQPVSFARGMCAPSPLSAAGRLFHPNSHSQNDCTWDTKLDCSQVLPPLYP